MSPPLKLGFRCIGKAGERRLIDWPLAFRAHADCDPRADLARESFLSYFTFGPDFARHLEQERSEARFGGPCAASWLFWDIDRPDDPGAALRDARRLVGVTLERYREYGDDDPLVFFSGAKGAHVGLPVAWPVEPSPAFHRTARAFCEARAREAGVAVDSAIYTKTRLLRAPNSRHPATALHKRRLTLEELTYLTPEAVFERAREPEPFEVPIGPSFCPQAAADWRDAEQAATDRSARLAERAAGSKDRKKLNARTMVFIREGCEAGGAANGRPGVGRHTELFGAAADLAELYLNGGLDALAHALLTEAALDTGLTPSDVARQIDCGLAHARRQAEGGAA